MHRRQRAADTIEVGSWPGPHCHAHRASHPQAAVWGYSTVTTAAPGWGSLCHWSVMRALRPRGAQGHAHQGQCGLSPGPTAALWRELRTSAYFMSLLYMLAQLKTLYTHTYTVYIYVCV